MPRKPRVPPYCLHKPSGRAIVKVTGRIIYLGRYDSEESHDNYARIVADLLAGRPITRPTPSRGEPEPTPRLTIADLASRYLQHVEGYYRKEGKQTSEVHAIRRALEFLRVNHSELQAAAFGIGDLKVVRQAIVDSGVSRSTVNRYSSRILRAFKWAATEELVPATVHASLAVLPGLKAGRTEAQETAPVESVDVEIVDATLPHLPEVVGDGLPGVGDPALGEGELTRRQGDGLEGAESLVKLRFSERFQVRTYNALERLMREIRRWT
ncbi:hypothetical protein NG895_04350, partial [Aeoliella sp. ICT_H6.2]|nr:hypothetical protein [Aeoliella straminimaris]